MIIVIVARAMGKKLLPTVVVVTTFFSILLQTWFAFIVLRIACHRFDMKVNRGDILTCLNILVVSIQLLERHMVMMLRQSMVEESRIGELTRASLLLICAYFEDSLSETEHVREPTV